MGWLRSDKVVATPAELRPCAGFAAGDRAAELRSTKPTPLSGEAACAAYYNQNLDKKTTKKILSWFLDNYGPSRTSAFLEELKSVGFHYATEAGISLGFDDLKIPPRKNFILDQAENQITQTERFYRHGRMTAIERYQAVIDIWTTASEKLKEEVIAHFQSTDLFNPLYMMAFSGARGNISQVRQLVGMRGLMSDSAGGIIDFPIRKNFREGLTITEYVISCYGARKGLIDTALRTADSGYLTRRLVDVAHGIMIGTMDCGTKEAFTIYALKAPDSNLVMQSLEKRILGRVCAGTNEEISPALAYEIIRDGAASLPVAGRAGRSHLLAGQQSGEAVHPRQEDGRAKPTASSPTSKSKLRSSLNIRSPLTCQTSRIDGGHTEDICQLCYGWSLAHGRLVSLGEAVGILAAQSIGEPGTQLTMRTFHTGGIFAGGTDAKLFAPHDGVVSFASYTSQGRKGLGQSPYAPGSRDSGGDRGTRGEAGPLEGFTTASDEVVQSFPQLPQGKKIRTSLGQTAFFSFEKIQLKITSCDVGFRASGRGASQRQSRTQGRNLRHPLSSGEAFPKAERSSARKPALVSYLSVPAYSLLFVYPGQQIGKNSLCAEISYLMQAKGSLADSGSIGASSPMLGFDSQASEGTHPWGEGSAKPPASLQTSTSGQGQSPNEATTDSQRRRSLHSMTKKVLSDIEGQVYFHRISERRQKTGVEDIRHVKGVGSLWILNGSLTSTQGRSQCGDFFVSGGTRGAGASRGVTKASSSKASLPCHPQLPSPREALLSQAANGWHKDIIAFQKSKNRIRSSRKLEGGEGFALAVGVRAADRLAGGRAKPPLPSRDSKLAASYIKSNNLLVFWNDKIVASHPLAGAVIAPFSGWLRPAVPRVDASYSHFAIRARTIFEPLKRFRFDGGTTGGGVSSVEAVPTHAKLLSPQSVPSNLLERQKISLYGELRGKYISEIHNVPVDVLGWGAGASRGQSHPLDLETACGVAITPLRSSAAAIALVSKAAPSGTASPLIVSRIESTRSSYMNSLCLHKKHLRQYWLDGTACGVAITPLGTGGRAAELRSTKPSPPHAKLPPAIAVSSPGKAGIQRLSKLGDALPGDSLAQVILKALSCRNVSAPWKWSYTSQRPGAKPLRLQADLLTGGRAEAKPSPPLPHRESPIVIRLRSGEAVQAEPSSAAVIAQRVASPCRTVESQGIAGGRAAISPPLPFACPRVGIIVRKIHPYVLSNEAALLVHQGEGVSRRQILCELFFEKSKTGDIVQGLPKIEQLFEARRTSTHVQDAIHLRLKSNFIEASKLYSQVEAAGQAIRSIQRILVDEIQMVYQSQGVDISDKHVEIIVRQMTSKVIILDSGAGRGAGASRGVVKASSSEAPLPYQPLALAPSQGDGSVISAVKPPTQAATKSYAKPPASQRGAGQSQPRPTPNERSLPFYADDIIEYNDVVKALTLYTSSRAARGTRGEVGPLDCALPLVGADGFAAASGEAALTTRVAPQGDGSVISAVKPPTHAATKSYATLAQPSFEPIVLGITKRAFLSESWASSASFQEAKKVLMESACESKIDFLSGLKSNLIVGRYIRAGTSFRR